MRADSTHELWVTFNNSSGRKIARVQSRQAQLWHAPIHWCSLNTCKKKGKVFPYSLPSVGPRADPGVQAVSPQVTWSESRHRPGSRLPLLSARPAVTSVAFTCKRQHTSASSLLLIYRPRKDERLSWPSWMTCSGRFTHISGHPSAAGRVQDRESSPVRDRRSTTVPHHQHVRK